MNRSHLFDECEEALTWMCLRIESRGKLNILNLHLHCEDFYVQLMNCLFGLNLSNLNSATQNVHGIDLIDHTNKVVLQVSATATKTKINAALSKDLSKYSDYKFKFISISKDASDLRSKNYSNPHALAFSPADDIYDVVALLKIILHADTDKQKLVASLIKKEIGHSGKGGTSTSNVASVIALIAEQDLKDGNVAGSLLPFNVDKKIQENNLVNAGQVIEDYKIHHHVVDRVYGEFDRAGKNKSKSVLDAFRSSYQRLRSQYSGDDLYFQIVDGMIGVVQSSGNYASMPIEELELCMNVLAVDAFIRCKIFKAPTDESNASA